MKKLPTILILLTAAGCTSLPQDAPRVSEITMSPVVVSLKVNSRQRLLVSGTVDARTVDVTHFARFKSNKPKVASVDENGLVRAVTPGETVITAKYRSYISQLNITVQPREENQPLSFVNDVLPILSKAGCNAGARWTRQVRTMTGPQ